MWSGGFKMGLHQGLSLGSPPLVVYMCRACAVLYKSYPPHLAPSFFLIQLCQVTVTSHFHHPTLLPSLLESTLTSRPIELSQCLTELKMQPHFKVIEVKVKPPDLKNASAGKASCCRATVSIHSQDGQIL